MTSVTVVVAIVVTVGGALLTGGVRHRIDSRSRIGGRYQIASSGNDLPGAGRRRRQHW